MKVLKQADFRNEEDDSRVVELSSKYTDWHQEQAFIVMAADGTADIARMQSDRASQSMRLNAQEMDALVEAWQTYQRELALYKRARA